MPTQQQPNPYTTPGSRFEMLTLQQTHKAPPVPIVLFDSAYWRRVIDFAALAELDMIADEHRALFEYADRQHQSRTRYGDLRMARAAPNVKHCTGVLTFEQGERLMKVGEYCKRSVVAISSSADAADAAKLMRARHVGFLIVYREGDPLQHPIGVLTDRDLVLGVMARDVDPGAVTVDDVMTRQPLIASDADELSDLLQAMRMAGIRRVPVVDVRGALLGIMALDDAIDLIAGLMCDISGSIKSEQRAEWRARAG